MTNEITNIPAVDHSVSNEIIAHGLAALALRAPEELDQASESDTLPPADTLVKPAGKKAKGQIQAKAPATPATPATKAPQASKKNFANQLKNLTDEDVAKAKATVAEAFSNRLTYEATKSAPSSKITSIEESAKRLTQDHAVKTLIVTGTDLNFANASAREGSRYNIYAIRDKIVDLCDALGKDKGILENKVNLAVMRSMFAYRNAGVSFTGNSSILATSDKIRVTEKTLNQILVRHTVSQATAGTQASSTMSALQTMGIVKNVGTSKAAVYEFTNAAAVKHLETMLTPAKAA